MISKKLNACDVKKHNRESVFRYIYSNGKCTKQEIAYGLRLSLPTVTTVLNELLEESLVENGGTASSTGGRKAKYVNINAGSRVFIGISVSKNHQRMVAVDLVANIILKEVFRNDSDISPEKLCVSLANNLEGFIDRAGVDRTKIHSVHVAVPGIVIPEKSLIQLAPTINYHDVPFKTLLKNIPYPAFIINDADAGGFSEWWNNGNLSEKKSLIYLSLNKGIGGSIYLNSKQYEGFHHRSGEFGHMCLVPGGEPCSCGKNGCFEAYCSISRLSDDLDCTIEEFFILVENGDKKAVNILDKYLDYLAIAILNISTVFDTPIVIGGVLSRFSSLYLDLLKEKIRALEVFNDCCESLSINKYTDMASSLGAAFHGISMVFEALKN